MIAAFYRPLGFVALIVSAGRVVSAQPIASLTIARPAAACDVEVPVTVMLSAPATAPVTVQFTSSIPAAIAAPAPVTIPTGQNRTAVRFPCVPTTQALAVTLSASTSGTTVSAVANVLPPALRGLSFKPDPRAAADLPPIAFTGAIELEGPAPANGVIVTLAANPTDAATLPVTVTVRGGDRRATVPVTNVRPVAAPQSITVVASALGVTHNATFTAIPAAPRDLRVFDARGTPLSSVTVGGNSDLRFRLVLNDVAGPGGTPIRVLSSAPSLVAPPASVRVPAGDSVVDFTIRTGSPAGNASATVTAAVGAVSRSVQVNLEAARLAILTLPALVGGAAGSGTIALSGPAPAGGLLVTLSSNAPSLSVPPSITVPAGERTAAFPVTTDNVDQGTPATVTASAAADRVSASTTIAAEGLSDFTLTPVGDRAGNSFTARLTAPRGHDGFTVALSAMPAIQITPAKIVFGTNETAKTVALTFAPVTQRTNTAVTARVVPTLTATATSQLRTVEPTTNLSAGGTMTAVRVGVAANTRSATAILMPPAVQRVTLGASEVIGGSRSVITGTITLAGPAPMGYAPQLTVSNPVAAIDQAPLFAAGATSATFTVRTLAVNQPTGVVITARSNDASEATARLIVQPR